MSASNAPTYYFTGIQFNSSFYAITTSGLSEGQANLLYLRKTVADTATALETFSNINGIKTNKIEPVLTVGNDLIIGSTISTTNRVYIGKTTGGLGVSFPSGISAQVIDTLGTSGLTSQMAIGGTRATTLTIGKTTYSTTVNSETSFPLKVNNIDSLLTTDVLSIGKNNTQGIIFGSNTPLTAGITIGGLYTYVDLNPITSGDECYLELNGLTILNIFTNSAFGTGTLNIGQPSSITTINGTVNSGRNTTGINPVYIETKSSTTSNTINFHSNNNYVTNYDSRIIASGGTVTDGQGDLTITSKSLNLSSPITLGSAPTTNAQLGFNIKNTTLIATAITSTANDLMSLTITSAGIWLISGFVSFYGSGTGVLFYYSFDYASAVQVLGNFTSSYNTATLPTYTYTATGSTTFTIKGNNNGGTDTAVLGFISATRIA